MNTRINVRAATTHWEFVCEGKDTPQMVAVSYEKMMEEHGEDVLVEVTLQNTTDAPNI